VDETSACLVELVGQSEHTFVRKGKNFPFLSNRSFSVEQLAVDQSSVGSFSVEQFSVDQSSDGSFQLSRWQGAVDQSSDGSFQVSSLAGGSFSVEQSGSRSVFSRQFSVEQSDRWQGEGVTQY
jgi:hypothetical protein